MKTYPVIEKTRSGAEKTWSGVVSTRVVENEKRVVGGETLLETAAVPTVVIVMRENAITWTIVRYLDPD